MRDRLSAADIERFRTIVARCLGLQFEDAKLGFLADIAHRRLEVRAQTAEVYLASLEATPTGDEVAALAQELTVGETYFFRHNDQYRAFAEVALPDRTGMPSTARRLRVLSAGCASGDEAYSLAILVREAALDPSWEVWILGVDVNPAAVRKATQALYSEWALRETPAAARQRWFKPAGRDFQLDDTLRGAVRFEERNLMREDAQLWQPDTYDIVFFRNVLMYFTPENAQAVVARIGRALRPGGYLFLGHAETLRGLSNDFHLRHTHETFYYQRKDGRALATAAPLTNAPTTGLDPSAIAVVEGTDTWVEAIRKATARIETLATSPQRPAPARSASPRAAVKSTWDLELARELLREERFGEALDLLRGLPVESGRDADVLLLLATLLTHRGRLPEAEEACRRLLEVDELSAGAHYLLALCREGVLDRASAVSHDQVAIYLDPRFAMPHLHLGLLARRAGDRTEALKELGQALLLLQGEDGSRMLLFGGGFSRASLVALCRTELVGCGGRP
jgi:chemotaxis protein methyltransferase CheR